MNVLNAIIKDLKRLLKVNTNKNQEFGYERHCKNLSQ